MNFDKVIKLTKQCKLECHWWVKNISTMHKCIVTPKPTHEIYCDASLSGWSCYLGDKKHRGLWNASERRLHINALELKAVENTLNMFCIHKKYPHKGLFR